MKVYIGKELVQSLMFVIFHTFYYIVTIYIVSNKKFITTYHTTLNTNNIVNQSANLFR
jgi:hypothetical protein